MRSSPPTARPRRAARSSCRRRRSITRSCRCCATRRSTSARIPTRGRRATASSTRRTRGSSSIGPWPVTSGCSARGPLGSGRLKARFPTPWCLWLEAAGFEWMATDEMILARTLGIAFGRDAGTRRSARAAVHALHACAPAAATGRLPLPRSRAVGPDWVHVRRLERRRRGQRLRRTSWSKRAAATRRGPAGERPPSQSSWTARTPGSTSRAAAGPSSARCTDGCRPTPSCGRSRCWRRPGNRPPTLDGIFPGLLDRRQLLHLDRSSRRPARLESAGRSARRRRHAERRRGGRGACPRRGAHRRRQRLVLVVRRRSFLGARPGIRRPVQAPPPECLSAARQDRSRTSCSSATSPAARRQPAERQPAGLLTPVLDGEETTYFEWLGAGLVEVRDTAGAMHQAERRAPVLSLLQFGFDRRSLYLRLDGDRPLVDLLGEGYEFSPEVPQPQGVRFSVRQDLGRLTGRFWDWRTEAPHWVARGPAPRRSRPGPSWKCQSRWPTSRLTPAVLTRRICRSSWRCIRTTSKSSGIRRIDRLRRPFPTSGSSPATGRPEPTLGHPPLASIHRPSTGAFPAVFRRRLIMYVMLTYVQIELWRTPIRRPSLALTAQRRHPCLRRYRQLNCLGHAGRDADPTPERRGNRHDARCRRRPRATHLGRLTASRQLSLRLNLQAAGREHVSRRPSGAPRAQLETRQAERSSSAGSAA